MALHEKFSFKTLGELEEKVKILGLDISFTTNLEPLFEKRMIAGRELPNSMAIHPMEGCDAQPDGSPSELTIRRYQRFAAGGAGLLWFEATAVVPEGRANPRQLWLHEGNVKAFRELTAAARAAATESMGNGHRPLMILQLTHSGRYSRPEGRPEPIIAFRDPLLDLETGVETDARIISDHGLEQLEDQFALAAELAMEAGFDGVDIKSCHRYLGSELLAARVREGRYGGSFDNRTRFLLQTLNKVKARTKDDLLLTVRLNAYDAHPYPYGWGVSKEDPAVEDLDEPINLVRLLGEAGVSVVNITAGNPYHNPYVGRPFDIPVRGGETPREHPLEGVARLFRLAGKIQEAVPEMIIVGTGYSWLRQFFPNAAAANMERGWVKLAGVGRQAFAYPDFAKDLLTHGRLDPARTCIACSKCTQIMRDGGRAGCVVRDAGVYLPIYRGARLN